MPCLLVYISNVTTAGPKISQTVGSQTSGPGFHALDGPAIRDLPDAEISATCSANCVSVSTGRLCRYLIGDPCGICADMVSTLCFVACSIGRLIDCVQLVSFVPCEKYQRIVSDVV